MLRRAPSSTLFPYTTLFRSTGALGLTFWLVRNSSVYGDIARYASTEADLATGLILEAGEGDRKSTRLNSSHSQISYAVFCLKKKKLRSRTIQRRSPRRSRSC